MKLSIIIPAFNEASQIGNTLARLHDQAPEAELLVVDGGSGDDTPALARKACPEARIIQGARGRALQLNQGAREAQGEWLLFLHADTCLPDGFLQAITQAEAAQYPVGVFGLRIAGRHPLLPWLGWGATWRTKLRHIFLGDQAPFVRRDMFSQLGGFPEQPLLEDYEFSRRLIRERIPLYVSPMRAETSGRRWDKGGFFRTWALMRWIYFDYHWRGSAERLAALYHHQR